MLQHKLGHARLCIFSRSGMVMTPIMCLSEADGMRSFIEAMVGVLCWKDKKAAGEDPFRSATHFNIPGSNLCGQITRVICHRNSLVGRSTFAAHVEIEEADSTPTQATFPKQVTSFASTSKRTQAAQQAKQIAPASLATVRRLPNLHLHPLHRSQIYLPVINRSVRDEYR